MDRPSTPWGRIAKYLSDLVRHCARELLDDRAEEMAAALTYRTIFALIPLAVLGLVLFRAFGGIGEMQITLQQQLYEFFGVPEVSYEMPSEPQPDMDETETQPHPTQDGTDEDDDAGQVDTGQIDANQADAGQTDAIPDAAGTRAGRRSPDLAQSAGRRSPDLAHLAAQDGPNQADGRPDRAGTSEHAGRDKTGHQQVRASIQAALTELTNQVTNLSFTSIGVVGMILFVYAAMSLVFSVEYDFNIIFDSPRGRPWHLRVAIYWSIITLGSGLLAASLYFTGQLVESLIGWDRHPTWAELSSRVLAFVASWVLLFLVYTLLPNAGVRIRPALIGSFAAALLWETGKVGFQYYVQKALPYSALYGSLGLVPLFLFWLYISWLIVLFGLELTYVMQVMRGKVPAKEDEPTINLAGNPEWLIPIVTQIGRAFLEGKSIGRQDLADRLGLPSRVVHQFGQELERAGMVHTVNGSKTGDVRYALARSPSQIRIAELLELGHQLSMQQRMQPALRGWEYLDGLHQAKCQAVGDMTLAGILEAQPAMN